MRGLSRIVTPSRAVLAVLLLAALALRLVHIDHGLPEVYHPDEAYHYTSRAVAMFRDGPDPGYFQNPSGFTYIVHLVLRLRYGDGWPFGSYDGLLAQYAADPTAAFTTARVVAAALCVLGAAAVFAVGRRLWGQAEGLAAAAVLGFAFLPVAYSRLAVTDVAVFAPVALALAATVAVAEGGGRRAVLVAGAAIGLAVGFKYTAGLLLVGLVVAIWLSARTGRARLTAAGLALGSMAVAFLVTTPYFLLDLHKAMYQLKVEHRAAGMPKLGQAADGPVVFYLHSLTWGLGWAAAVAAAAGVFWLARHQPRRALLLGLFPVLLFAYLVTADRYFARWLMPAYPALALLAGVCLVRAAAAASAHPRRRAAVLAVLVAAVLAQPVAADLRTARLLGREDTRAMARDYMDRTLPAGTRVVAEPAVPAGFFGHRYALGFGPPAKTAGDQAASPTRFIRTLRPDRIDRYRRAGYCVVVTMSLIRDRAMARHDPGIQGYYDRLARESRVLYHASPYRAGASPVPYDADISTHLYYPRAYVRPGPEVTIYRLDRCGSPVGRASAARTR